MIQVLGLLAALYILYRLTTWLGKYREHKVISGEIEDLKAKDELLDLKLDLKDGKAKLKQKEAKLSSEDKEEV